MENRNLRRNTVNLICLIMILVSSIALNVQCTDQQRIDVVRVSPAFELNGMGENIDSIAFWEAPEPDSVLMFVTGKKNSLVEVWKFPFINNEQTPLSHPTFEGSNVNGVVVDQETDLLYVSIGNPASTTSVFKLPELEFVMEIHKDGANLKSEPNLALLKLHNGSKRIYISADKIIYIHDAATGRYLGEFKSLREVETMVADNFYQALYIPDENNRSGVYAYKPDGSHYPKSGTNRFGGEGIFEKDGEGILVYARETGGQDNGEGLIVVADQRKPESDFEIFDRKSWTHLGTFRIPGVSNTDGTASTQRSLPGYPHGLLAVVNDDTSVVCVGWDKVLQATGLFLE